jgi:hypothetical protein
MAELEENVVEQVIEADLARALDRMENDPEFRQVIRNLVDLALSGDFVPRGRWVEVPDPEPGVQER